MKFFNVLISTFLYLFSVLNAAELERIDFNIPNNTGDSRILGFEWDATFMDSLPSWRVEFEFTLSKGYEFETQIPFFWTFYSSSKKTRLQGITLFVTESLQLKVEHSQKTETSEEYWFAIGETYTMTLQFIVFENELGIAQKGEFSVISGEKVLTYTLDNVEMLQYAAFRKSDANFSATRFEDYNGMLQYSLPEEISLYYLTNRIIPEPSTAMLSLLSVIFFVRRRRRQ